MFQLELLEQLNKFKKTDDNYELAKIKESVGSLVAQNNEEYKKFISAQDIDVKTRAFLEECENLVLEKEQQKNNANINNENDYEVVKSYYEQWLDGYKSNNNVPNERCEQIILSIINFYLINRFQVLERVLSINDTQDFENFKNMLKNYLRKIFAEKIEGYFISEAYNGLNFFDKRKKKRQILKVLDEIGEYKFNQEKIREVIEE